MPDPKKHLLKNVSITRIAVVKNPAVRDSEIVLMKSADAEQPGEDAMLKNFGERLLDWVQQRLAKTTTPTTESPDMDLKNLKLEELESARPDLVKAIADKNKPAAGDSGAAGTSTDVSKGTDPFAGLRASLEAIKTQLTDGLKGMGDRVATLEKAAKPEAVDLTAINKSIEDLKGKIETLSKAQPQALKHGDEEPVRKSEFGGVFKALRKGDKNKTSR